MKRYFRRTWVAVGLTSIGAFVAIGGPSYADSLITGQDIKNSSITGIDIKSGTVRTSDITNNSLGSSDIKNGSLLKGDFKPGQLPSGPAGPAGPKGATGTAFGALAYRASAEVSHPAGTQVIAQALCPAGMYAVGGGGILESSVVGQSINSSFPSDGAQGETPLPGTVGWAVYADNETEDPSTVTAYAICAPAGTVSKPTGINKAARK